MGLRFTEEEYAAFIQQRRHGRITTCDLSPAAPPPPPPPKRSKYGNRRVEIDGLKFDSQHEADFYFGTLLPAWKCGAYKMLARQVPFDLPGGIKYVADFVTVSVDGHVCIMDAKSAITRKNRAYINKRKQMKACWGLEIQEV